jgi:hypothetical protein
MTDHHETIADLVARWQERSLALRRWQPAASHMLDICVAELEQALDQERRAA